ncbi:MAG: hypothetical protein FWD01_05110, partial [Defluviitaleaceae bacterium]|nr:hypothetical protein [Defluviitaleaceae bacterium]
MRKKLLLIVGLSVLLTSLSFGLGFFWWTSYATFDYSLQPIIALQGQNISPSDFLIESGRNSRNIQANFRNHTMNYSNLNPGIHEIPINISLGWRTAASVATLYILAPADYVRIEYAQPPERLTPLDFISNADIIVDVSADVAFDVDFVGEPPRINAIPIGRFPVELELNGMMFTSMLDVAITESPSATMADLTIPAGQAISANQFVEDISHAVEIDSIDFLTEPDIFRSGEQVVNIVIQDIFGNRGNFEAMLTVLPNTVPPVILGVTSPIEVMRGNNILFRQGVSAYDAFGRRLDFAVDSSLVNPNLEGHYTAVYRAEDADGLYAEIEIDVFIVSVDPQWVHERVDEILTGIFRDGMTQVEQARAIFDWVSANIMYAG